MYQQAIQLIQAGRAPQALQLLHMLRLNCQHDPAYWVNLGICLEEVGQFAEAYHTYRLVVDRWPNNVEALSNLGNLLVRMGRIDEGEQCHLRRHALKPNAYSINALAKTHIEQLRIEQAIEELKTAATDAHSASEFLGWSLHTGYDASAHEQWVRQYAPRFYGSSPVNHWDGKRPLRIGYLGASFCRSAVASCLESVLANHNTQVEVHIFSDVRRFDDTTERFKGYVAPEHWHTTVGLDDLALVQAIRAAGIDCIIDLEGHKRNSRLGALANWPAVVMLGYLGYAGNTFITRNVDREVGWAYRPDPAAPPVLEPPCLSRGVITFGSVARPAKLTTQTIQLWAKVLETVPNSRLLLPVCGGNGNTAAREQLIKNGIPEDRLVLWPRPATHADYLNLAAEFDICLDTFPYNGGATTLDMLWQGVPTITMTPENEFQMGASMPSAQIATNPSSFVTVCKYAANPDNLKSARLTVRERMKDVLDGRRFAARMKAVCLAAMEQVGKSHAVGCCD